MPIQGTRTGGWSRSGELQVGGPTFGGDPGVNLQVDFYGYKVDDLGHTKTDPRQRPASIYTVEINVDTLRIPRNDPDLLASPHVHVNPIATIDFSTEGNTVRREVSCVNGVSISGVCDHINVLVRDFSTDSALDAVAPGTDLSYTVAILVTPGTRPARHSPPYLATSVSGSLAAATVAGGGTTLIAIPPDAGAITICAFSNGDGIPVIEQRDFGGAVLAAYDPSFPEFVPLIPQAQSIALRNTGAALTNEQMTVIFGIDG